jgi:RNA polymerase sigma-B factor
MREANLTEDRPGRELGSAEEGWRPLAQQLSARFAPAGGNDEGMIQAAVAVILVVERRLGSRGAELTSLVVPLVIRALRRHRREQFRRRPDPTRPFLALQVAIAGAESELFGRLRRSPTVYEVAGHLGVAEHQIIAGLEAGWSAGSSVKAAG